MFRLRKRAEACNAFYNHFEISFEVKVFTESDVAFYRYKICTLRDYLRSFQSKMNVLVLANFHDYK
jgi:hypothetical protein